MARVFTFKTDREFQTRTDLQSEAVERAKNLYYYTISGISLTIFQVLHKPLRLVALTNPEGPGLEQEKKQETPRHSQS